MQRRCDIHLYNKEGQPMYEIPYVDPKKGMRKTTLRDARKHNWYPSVTEVLSILNKPGLNMWLQDRILESALTITRKKGEPDKVFFARIKQDAKELSILARDEGTRIHDALEKSFNDDLKEVRYSHLCDKVKAAVFEYFGTTEEWKTEVSFGHVFGFGGKVDLVNKRVNVVVDYKTKEEFKPKMAYDEHCMQLVAYSKGLKIPDARLINIFVDYDGNTIFHEWPTDEAERGWDMFQHVLALWKLIKKYYPMG